MLNGLAFEKYNFSMYCIHVGKCIVCVMYSLCTSTIKNSFISFCSDTTVHADIHRYKRQLSERQGCSPYKLPNELTLF